jgi:hypothetical protein
LATRADEFEPQRDVIERVVADAVRPLLRLCEDAAGGPFAATVTLWVGESAGPSMEVLSSGEQSRVSPVHAEVRLRFRRTFNPRRLLFRAEAQLEGIPAEFRLSGFHLSGAAHLEPEAIRIQPSGRTYCYNVSEWRGWC